MLSHVHPRDFADKMLPPNLCLGSIDSLSLEPKYIAPEPKPNSTQNHNNDDDIPDLNEMLNCFDFEDVARSRMSNEGWQYYSSGADDELTLRENHLAFQRIWFIPRVLVNVEKVDLSTNILGCLSSFPLYISATALGKLAHPEGECALVRAAHHSKVIYMIPTLSSCSVNEMLDSRAKKQVVFSQLYVNVDRNRTKEYVSLCEKRGVKALFVTVDAPQLGRREKDMRNKYSSETDVQKGDNVNRSMGTARGISSFIDPSFSWTDLKSILQDTSIPIVLKGVQCAADAVLAFQYGCSGIVLSNHGGRQLDTCRSGIEILPEVMQALKLEPGYSREKFEIFVDGGIRRGSDIVKALALGATAVGIGRPALYALAAYGPEGVQRLLGLLKSEMEMVMRLIGTPSIQNISESYVTTRNLRDHTSDLPRDNLSCNTYLPLRTARDLKSKI